MPSKKEYYEEYCKIDKSILMIIFFMITSMYHLIGIILTTV